MKIIRHIHTMNYLRVTEDRTKDVINASNTRIGFNFKEGHNKHTYLWGGYVL